MKRKTINKIAILMCGLITVPLFSLSANALYTEISPDINVSISGKIEPTVKTFNVYKPNNTTTDWEVAYTMTSDKTIASQIDESKFADVNNFISDKEFYGDKSLLNAPLSKDSKPTDHLYLKYTGYFAKGTDAGTNYEPLTKDLSDGLYKNEEATIDSFNFKVFQKTYKDSYSNINGDFEFIEKTNPTNVQTNSGVYNITYNSSNNETNVLRTIYLDTNKWSDVNTLADYRILEEDTSNTYTLYLKTNSYTDVKCYLFSSNSNLNNERPGQDMIYDSDLSAFKISFDKTTYDRAIFNNKFDQNTKTPDLTIDFNAGWFTNEIYFDCMNKDFSKIDTIAKYFNSYSRHISSGNSVKSNVYKYFIDLTTRNIQFGRFKPSTNELWNYSTFININDYDKNKCLVKTTIGDGVSWNDWSINNGASWAPKPQ